MYPCKKIVSLFVTLDCYLQGLHGMFNVSMKKTSLQTKPYMLTDGENKFESLGALISIMASAEQTGGVFNLFDILLPLGYETPLHIHYAEDVAIHVLEGTLDIFLGDEKKRAVAGSFFFQPRGTPHGFRVIGTAHARISYMTVPAGFDEFIIACSKPFSDLEAMMLEARYKIEILGSLPALD
jgi:quercetin dioxygenase-like cupin family protein